MDTRHIPRVRNPTDALTRKDWAHDPKCIQKVKEKESDMVKILKVDKNASSDEIRSALRKLFNEELSRQTEDEETSVPVLAVSKETISLQDDLREEF